MSSVTVKSIFKNINNSGLQWYNLVTVSVSMCGLDFTTTIRG